MFLFFCILFLAAPRLLQKNSTPATKEVKKGKAPRRDTHKHKPTILLPVSFSFPASLISCSSFAFPYRFRWFMRHTMQCRFFFLFFFCWGISLLMNSNIWCSEIAKQQWIVHTHTHTRTELNIHHRTACQVGRSEVWTYTDNKNRRDSWQENDGQFGISGFLITHKKKGKERKKKEESP